MNENKIANITSIKIIDDDKNKKININLDIFNEELIFEGYSKIKVNGVTQWCKLVVEKHAISKDSHEINFEKISKSIYDAMIRKIELYELVQGFLYEVTEIEIKKD